MDDKITIIEGPPPVFEPVQDGWAISLNEGPALSITVLTRMRTFNGPALVERCYRAWRDKAPIHLHYRNDMGLEEQTPIDRLRRRFQQFDFFLPGKQLLGLHSLSVRRGQEADDFR